MRGSSKSQLVTFRLPRELVTRVDAHASREGTTRTTIVQSCIEVALSVTPAAVPNRFTPSQFKPPANPAAEFHRRELDALATGNPSGYDPRG